MVSNCKFLFWLILAFFLVSCASATLYDDFNDNSLNATKWTNVGCSETSKSLYCDGKNDDNYVYSTHNFRNATQLIYNATINVNVGSGTWYTYQAGVMMTNGSSNSRRLLTYCSFTVGGSLNCYSAVQGSVFVANVLMNKFNDTVTINLNGVYSRSLDITSLNDAWRFGIYALTNGDCTPWGCTGSDSVYLDNLAYFENPSVRFVYPARNQQITSYKGWINFTTDRVVLNCSINDSRWLRNKSNTSSFKFFNSNFSNLTAKRYDVGVQCNSSEGQTNDTLRWYKYGATAIYDLNVYERTVVPIKLVVLGTNSYGSTASLVYNNTVYSVLGTTGFQSINFSANVLAPNISGVARNITFVWTYNVSGQVNSLTKGQWVSRYIFDNCSVGKNKTLTIKVFDEEQPSIPIVSSLEVDGYYWSDPLYKKHINYALNKSSTYTFCLENGLNQTLFTDLYLKYHPTGGFTQSFYFVNESLRNRQVNYSIYNFVVTAGLSDLKLTLRNFLDYSYLENVYVKMLRYYVGEGVWRTVQMDKSGGFGQTFFNIKEENTDYKFIFFDENNNILESTGSMKFVCSGGVCDITKILTPYGAVSPDDGLLVSLSFDNDSSSVLANWTDIFGVSADMRFVVSKESFTGNYTICDDSGSGSGGSFSCNVAGHTGTIYAQVFSTQYGVTRSRSSLFTDIRVGKLSNLMSKGESALWTVAFVLTSMMMGIFSPVAAVIMTVFGLLGASYLGLMNALSITFVVIAAIIGIFISTKVRR